jgi:hypothetical protein
MIRLRISLKRPFKKWNWKELGSIFQGVESRFNSLRIMTAKYALILKYVKII